MNCPHCGFGNPLEAVYCSKCGRQLLLEGATVTGPVTLAGRYEVLQLLGEGGMGAVYKARDRELDRPVALKVIRPELASDLEVLQRFKQELILARKITHKNVIRIYDFGESEGTKFISMEYIDGQDLKTLLLERGKLPHEAAVRIIQQVCRALRAAHSEGVVHRDLKPRNIMLDQAGNVFVMDFGIAHSLELSGLTRVGALVGTPEYMSPEQAKGLKVDQRSDLFSLGIIFYELLTGQSPFQADSTMGTLLKRTQEPAVPPLKLDASIPPALSGIVVKCLQIDPQLRYQDAREILQDLESRQGLRTPTDLSVPPAPPKLPALRLPPMRARKWIAAGAVTVLLASAGVLIRERIVSKPAAKPQLATVLVADFNNATGEPIFNGTLEPVFITAIEGASFINAYDRGAARRTAAQVQPGATKLDEPVARLVAQREGLNYVVAGSILRHGEGYQLSLRATEAVTGKVIVTREIEAANKEAVLRAMNRLAAQIRNALGDDIPESLQLNAAETFTAASLEAAHNYARGQEVFWAGKLEEAIPFFLKAAELDPNLGRAYASLMSVYINLGQRQEAEKYYQMAVARIDYMSDREKYRTRGVYYILVRNPEKAIEEFATLLKQYPADIGGNTNLGMAYSQRRDFARALEQGRRTLQLYPKNLIVRNNVAGAALRAGDFETAAREARAFMEGSPSRPQGYTTQALAELAQGRPARTTEIYQRLEKVGSLGASRAASGLADLSLYEGRLADATNFLEKGIAADVANNNPAAAAKKRAILSEAHLVAGRKAAALAAADRAVPGSKDGSVLVMAARVFIQAGKPAKARELASQLGKRLEPDPQAYCKLIEGEIQRERGDLQAAIKLFQEAQKLADTWLGRFLLSRAYVEAEAYTEASSELELCLKRRGEAAEVFLDDVPTYRYFPLIYYYLGRAQDGLKSSGGAESYRAFLAIKAKDEGDPLVQDARRRIFGR